jgi:hypothetical protein
LRRTGEAQRSCVTARIGAEPREINLIKVHPWTLAILCRSLDEVFLEDAIVPHSAQDFLEAIGRSFPEISVWSDAPPDPGEFPDNRLLRSIRAELGDRFGVFTISFPRRQPAGGVEAVIRLPDGSAVAAHLDPRPPGLGPTPVPLSALVFLAVAISLLSLWAARSLTAPLTRFADAAERFSVAMPHKDSGFQIGVKR